MNEINYSNAKNRIVTFISKKAHDAVVKGAVIGLSGGIDSTITAYLTVDALGSKNVLGVLLPEKSNSSKQDIDDALEVSKLLGIEYKIIDISKILNSFSYAISDFDKYNLLAYGNLKARTRMCILYYHANLLHRMVIGTGNRTELLLGYFSKYGDGGVDIEPIGGLFKTQVRGLGRYMNIPEQIIDKIPTAGLWHGQTDEGELGITYEEADKILSMLIDEKKEVSDIKKKFPSSNVDKIIGLLHTNEHKRMLPASCDV